MESVGILANKRGSLYSGSGFFFKDKFITCYHIVNKANSIKMSNNYVINKSNKTSYKDFDITIYDRCPNHEASAYIATDLHSSIGKQAKISYTSFSRNSFANETYNDMYVSSIKTTDEYPLIELAIRKENNIDINLYCGMSGGLVRTTDGDVLGMISRFNTATNLVEVIPMTFILDLITNKTMYKLDISTQVCQVTLDDKTELYAHIVYMTRDNINNLHNNDVIISVDGKKFDNNGFINNYPLNHFLLFKSRASIAFYRNDNLCEEIINLVKL